MTHVTNLMAEGVFGSLPDRMSDWTDHVLGPSFHKYRPAEAWEPAVNIYEDDAQYCLVVDLAGVRGDEIDLHVNSGMMILSGRRAAPGMRDQHGRKRVHVMEIDHGPFRRKVQLPDNVDINAIEASYRNGYLWIKLLKTS